MASATGTVFSRTRLTGKTYDEISAALAQASRDDLVRLVFSLVTLEKLLTPAQIARESQVPRRDVLADMRAGRFTDPIFGRGFFCRASKSFRISASAVNAWRATWFVAVRRAAIPAEKKSAPVASSSPPVIGVGGTKTGQNGQSARLDSGDVT